VTYKGFDFTEIAQRFGILPEGDLENVEYDDDNIVPLIQDHISQRVRENLHLSTFDSKEEKELREHLTLLIGHGNSYQTPVWEGLLNVKDTHTFLQMCIPLIGYMWD
jgi:hypothetical protein